VHSFRQESPEHISPQARTARPAATEWCQRVPTVKAMPAIVAALATFMQTARSCLAAVDDERAAPIHLFRRPH
jgi:hypothetical protein